MIRVTDRHGGFVLSSSVSAGEGRRPARRSTCASPPTALQAAVADLSELAHVRSRTQAARDITAEFASPRRRLADALAERRGLLRQLAQAVTPNETAAVRARLRAVNRRVDRARRELRRLRERVALLARERRGRARRATAGRTAAAGRSATPRDDALSVLGAVAGAHDRRARGRGAGGPARVRWRGSHTARSCGAAANARSTRPVAPPLRRLKSAPPR